MTEQLDGQVGWFDQDTWSGKTYPEPSAAAEAKTSKQSLKKSSGSSKITSPICLMLSKAAGQNQDASTTSWVPGALLGAYTTRSFGESPREENVSRLSQILEDSPHPKYSLSAKACQGILNRAERRGKKLPKALEMALRQQSLQHTEPNGTEMQKHITEKTLLSKMQSVSKNEPENLGVARESSSRLSIQEHFQPLTTSPSFAAAFMGGQGSKAGGIAYSEDVSPSLKSVPSGGNTTPDELAVHINGNDEARVSDVAYTVSTNANATGRNTALAVDCRNGRENPCVNGTLQSKESGYNLNNNNVIRVSSS